MLSVWTGKLLLVFTPTGGGAFDPCTNQWRRASINGMPPMYNASLPYAPVVAKGRIVVLFPATPGNWSAETSTVAAAVYDMGADRWETLPLGGSAPAPRDYAAVAWTGTEIIVWGGDAQGSRPTPTLLGDGARLDPATGRWTPMSNAGAPAPRIWAGAQWTASRFVVLGGNTQQSSPYTCDPNGSCAPAAPGGTYDPATDTWQAHPSEGAPTLGPYPSVTSNGTQIVVWQNALAGGHAIYDPAANRWEALPDPPGLLASSRQPFRAWVDGDRFVAVESNDAAAVLDIGTLAWTRVAPAQLPASTGAYGVAILGGDRFVGAMGHDTYGPSVPGDLQGGWIGRVDAQNARWEVAPLPVAGSPPSIIGTMAWTGERLVVWGGGQTVVDPTGSTGCQNAPPNTGCDPTTPTKIVYGNEGGLLAPVFAPAPLL